MFDKIDGIALDVTLGAEKMAGDGEGWVVTLAREGKKASVDLIWADSSTSDESDDGDESSGDDEI
jgi:hypothetical protein